MKSLDLHLWRACAGKTARIPAEGSAVFYFPQGHAENANCTSDFAAAALGLPPLILCRVEAVALKADPETDEVFAAIALRPAGDVSGEDRAGEPEDPRGGASFAKILTQSDANNGGGFSVPRHCADTVFPALNYAADPPVQELAARDVHGEVWKFRHIYRGTPRRHLLTSGWSVFVNRKRLVARDSIVFLRSDSGEIRVGIRRARRTAAQARVRAEEFAEAARRAARGEPFEAVYYPRDGAAEFCVGAPAVRAALAEPWRNGLRMKMSVEDEVNSRLKHCNGSVAALKAFDPIRWPDSPWRVLEVSWEEEPDKQQNPKFVSPWMIELVPSMPICPHFPPDEQPRKKLRPDHHTDFIFSGQFAMPPASILSNPLGPHNPLEYLHNISPAGIQGARHLVFEVPIPDLLVRDQLQLQLFPTTSPLLSKPSSVPNGVVAGQLCGDGSLSCLLAVEQNGPNSESNGGVKKHVVSVFGEVFGQVLSHSSDAGKDLGGAIALEKNGAEREKSDGSLLATGLGLKIGCCKVFKEFADVGWTIDLSVVGSYEELYKSLSNEFNIERSAITTRVLYHDATGAPKQTGDRPFSDFMKVAKRLTIIPDPKTKNEDKKKD